MSDRMTAGFAQLVVTPTFAGMNKDIEKAISGTFPQLGSAAGADFGKGVASGFAETVTPLEREVKEISVKVARAQDDVTRSKRESKTATDNEAKALGDLRVAQLKLDEARANSKTKASQLATAEENLAEKTRKADDAATKAKDALARLDTATENLTKSQDELKTATQKANDQVDSTDTTKSRRALDKLGDTADKTREGFKGLGGYISGGFAAIVAGFSLAAIKGELDEVITKAGELEQSSGAIDAVFKGQASKMHAKAETAAVDVGLDKNEYNELATLIGAQLKNAKIPLEQLPQMTDELVRLGADLASMFGGTTREAVEAISSTLKGEMDPIEKYGITLTADMVTNNAATSGLVQPIKDEGKIADAKVKHELAQKRLNEAVEKYGKDSDQAKRAQLALNTASQAVAAAERGKTPKIEGSSKALSVLSLLTQQSADAQGNFARESDTYAHKQQVNAASWSDFGAAMGEKFLPMATAVTSFMTTDVLPALEQMWKGLEVVGTWVQKNSAWLGPLAAALGGAAAAMVLWNVGAAVGNGLLPALAGGWRGLNTAMKANPILLIVSLVAGLVGALIVLWNTNEDFRNFFITAWKNISSFIGTVWNSFILPALRAIGDFITTVLVPVFVWLYENVVKPVFAGIKTVIAVVIAAVIVVIKSLIWVWQNLLGPALSFVWTSVIKPVFKALGDFFGAVWSRVLKPAFEAVVRFWKVTLGPAISFVWTSVIKPAFKALGDFFKWVWESVLRPAFGGVKTAFEGIGTFVSNIWNNSIKPVFSALGDFVSKTVAPAFQAGVDAIGKIWETVRDIAKKPIEFVINTVINDGIIGAFNTVAGFLGIGKLDRISVPGFAGGGWTGPGSKYQEAGVVHADEFVIRKESQRKLARSNPGLLDHLNRTGQVPGYAGGGLVKPADGPYTSRFGESRKGYAHAGLDMAVPVGTPVVAALPGTVGRAGWNAIGGRTGIGVFLDHADGRSTYYGHLSQALVEVGQAISQGQMIGRSGNTGNSTGPHLHFELWNGGRPIDPEQYLAGAALPEGGGAGANPLDALFNVGKQIKGWITNAFPGGGAFVDMALGAGQKVFTSVKDWAVAKLKEIGEGIGKAVVSEDALENLGVFEMMGKQALQYTGDYSDENLASLLRRMKQESGFNPKAINNWDSNAKRGTPSKGLMQVIDPTFQAYRDPKLSSDIFDPMANIVASIRYTKARYGSLRAGWDRAGGYSAGGLVTPSKYDSGGWMMPGTQVVTNQTTKPEPVFTNGQWTMIRTLTERGMDSSRRGGDTYNVYANAAISGRDVADELAFASRVNNRRS